MRNITFIILFISTFAFGQYPDGKEILEEIDRNMSSDSRIYSSDMVIHGRRGSRTISSRTWLEGEDQSFTEYLAPAREKGTKMLKLEDKLWMYSPGTDRTIQISGHMLKQSVMGSDLSYEDMLDDKKLTTYYDAVVTDEEDIDGRKTWIVELTANKADVAYHMRRIWVDQQRTIPLRQELYAKSGKLLKRLTLSDVVKIEGRWFPRKMTFKDMLKDGQGTEFIINDIQFDVSIPQELLSKASLRK
jgi:outer membrane lipoprotein-sorting protein